MMTAEALLKNRLTPLLLATVLTLTVSVFWAKPFSGIEAIVGDQLWRLIGNSAVRERRVVVIDIDEASITRYGAWPWPRERTAELLNRLNEQGVEQRIVDIAFPEAKPGDDQLAAALLKTPTVLAQILAINAGQDLHRGELQGGLFSNICTDQFPVADSAIGNAPGLHAASAGHITPRMEADGVIRKLPAVICYQHKAYPALALAALPQAQA